jgi:hypothetical protein
MDLLENFNKLNNKLTDLVEENKKLKQQHKNIQEENQELKKKFKEREEQYQQHVLNLEQQKNELEEKVLNLGKQKSTQLEIISQNLEKALGKLELNDEDEMIKEKNKYKPAIDPLIGENDDSLQNEVKEDVSSAEHSWSSLKKGM